MGMMKHFVVAAVAVTVMGTFGAGLAAARGPNPMGKTYRDAAEDISAWGWTATIATVIGAQTATDDCLVIGFREASFLDSDGGSRNNEMLLDLDCNARVAAAGQPGHSAGSPEGRAAKKEIKTLTYYGKDPAKHCASIAAYCRQLCEKYADSCSSEMQDFLADMA
jgi:hypothetical protein